jgi:cytochrome b pre-mRNA-processing protein 6
LRPDVQFQNILKKRLDRKFLPPKTTPGEAEVSKPVPQAPIDEQAELAQANAIYALVDNRFSRKVRGSMAEELCLETDLEKIVPGI